MRRIGIDVGGTNTDAVLIDGDRVLVAVKTVTTADVLGGVRTALSKLLAETASWPGHIAAVVIGTTHFTDAVIERRALQRVGALRIGLPASASLPPFVDWPEDLAALVRVRERQCIKDCIGEDPMAFVTLFRGRQVGRRRQYGASCGLAEFLNRHQLLIAAKA